MLVLLNKLAVVLELALLVSTHAGLVECTFASLSDFVHSCHCFECCLNVVPIVSDWDIATLCEGEGAIDGHFLSMSMAISLSPAKFPWISLHLKVLVAFALAESEGFGIQPHKCNALRRVDRRRAEMTCFDPHFEKGCEVLEAKIGSQRRKGAGRRGGCRGDRPDNRQKNYLPSSRICWLPTVQEYICPLEKQFW